MRYTLHQLAPGSYDLAHDGGIAGGVVRNVTLSGWPQSWIAQLLKEVPPDQRPAPFSEVEHSFKSLEAVIEWLGNAAIAIETSEA
ncbi:hypothetical protein [Methylobacterium sp. J-090]|uniref:hypothetical protein n=1 Tax=Methylobacterium sp. J-090 TaxID=2836666 RepID=UPI001FBA9898|nr:hypothetical protein [Methylobacterium sp. J-090]MCJ2080776.1 hypothetical protein [Methylobacterium sp. J-090]